jgi:dTDP-4-amino-4,6-dideoxygalactose transaminase
MNVPFVDLSGQYRSIKDEIDGAIASVIGETTFIGGRFVSEFEAQFAEAYDVKHAISCGNGTDSLYIIMKMLGIGQGDEVITVSNSWISSSETITQTGARVVFTDVHPDYFSMDESLIEEKITGKTRAVLVVHLQGQACEMEVINAICKKHALHLIEDCAQSHFSEYKGKRTGLFGIAASFSFYPGKNLGAYGDAGCMITNDDALAEKLRMYARHGALKKHQHRMEGVNSRMDSMQAAILSAKLPHIHQWTDSRISHAKRYDQHLAGMADVKIPKVRPSTKHTYHLYVIRCKQRDELAAYLKTRGVETSVHYPTPLPFLPAYRYLGHKPQDFPVVYQHQGEILSLPMYPELKPEEIKYVADAIRNFYAGA